VDRPAHRRGFLLAAAAAAGTGALPLRTSAQAAPTVLRIGYQFGLVYAPVLLMKEFNLLKRYAPGLAAEYSQVASGNTIRDQMIAKQLDIGVLGPPPFLTGWQHLNWKYVVGTGIFPYQLVTWRKDLKSLKDFGPEDKIAVPGPSSLQSILLGMAAKKELGDARALQKNTISLPHPDATASMLSKNPSVAAHFANIPFLFRELDAPHIHVVLDGFEAFGGKFTSPMAFAPPDIAERNPAALAAFVAAYNEAVAMINLDPAKAAKALAPGLKESPETIQRWLRWPGITYTSLPYGIMGWHDFMVEAGFIKKAPTALSNICSDQMLAWIGLEAGNAKNPVQRLQERGST
jgi:NitT/TauT family transport system substrate-binding protein